VVEQKFDASWKELVAHAHAVGDFGAPGHEGRFPDPEIRLTEAKPHASLGSGDPWVAGPHGHVSLGNPLCRACKAPVVVVSEPNVFATECSSCLLRRRYERGPARTYKVARIVADEHEAERREVGILPSKGAMIITCPNCNGQLSGVKQRVGHTEPPSKVWWLNFDSPCAERKQLLRRANQATAHRDKQRGQERMAAAMIACDNAKKK